MTLLNRGLVVAGVLVALTAMVPWRPQAPREKHGEECPHYWGSDQGGPLPYPDTIPIAGPSTNVPEYNDCQRFIERSGKALRYGAIQAVWVRYGIRSWMQAPHLIVPPIRVPTTTVPGFPMVGPITAASQMTVVGVVFSRGDYKPLGIKQGFDCLVLKWDRVGPTVDPASYKAWMVPVTDLAKCSGQPATLGSGAATQLRVTSIPAGSGAGGLDEVPEVARWDWDAQHELQYVSMWCPTGWCEFHPARFSPSPQYTLPTSLGAVNHSVIQQKGWYDQQLLADPAAGTAGPRIEPARLLGTVFPVPGLTTRTVGTYQGAWRQVAWVSLDKSSPAYEAKYMYQMDQAPPNGTSDNLVFMCFEKSADRASASSAPIASSTGQPRRLCGDGLPPNCTEDTKNQGHWYSRVISASGTNKKTYCVLYRPAPPNVSPPGVVRWRWTLKDETLWISCPSGCCEADAKV